MNYNDAQDSVQWCCPDFADGEVMNTQFAIRFDCTGAWAALWVGGWVGECSAGKRGMDGGCMMHYLAQANPCRACVLLHRAGAAVQGRVPGRD